MTRSEDVVDEVVNEALALKDDDEDIAVFFNRHGRDELREAVEYAIEREDGSMNHRIMAREIDLSMVEAEVILQALTPVVRDVRGES
ncbi:DUF7437 domain-containing protein [Natribaculum luteum]